MEENVSVGVPSYGDRKKHGDLEDEIDGFDGRKATL